MPAPDEAEALEIASNQRIEMMVVEDWEDTVNWLPTLIPVDTEHRAEIAHHMARNFHQEMHFDGPPYTSHDFGTAGRNVFLVRDRSSTTMAPIVCGALEVIETNMPVLTWAWLHPFERGSHRHTWLHAWREINRLYPNLAVEAPVSHRMKAFLDRHSPDTRIVTQG